MTTEDQYKQSRDQIEAVRWWLRLHQDPAAGFSTQFQEWIANPANEQSLRTFELADETLDKCRTFPAIAEMHRSAQTWLDRRGADHRPLRKPFYAMAAAALLIAIGTGFYHLWWAQHSFYRTATTERRALDLEDGSHVLLDSDSELAVHFSKHARVVLLKRGQARFDVAHNMARPFSVVAGAETVIAVGTAFDVELRGSKVLVTLIKGRVLIKGDAHDVLRSGEAPTPLQLSAGQQMVVSTGTEPAIAPADLAVTQAWEAGHLVFHGVRLVDAVEQINRYTDHPITVDPTAASFRLSGVFNTGDTQSFVDAAKTVFGLKAVTHTDGTVTLQKGR